MTSWFFHSGSGDRIGPFDDSAAQQYAQQHPAHFCWREGFTGWRPIAEVGELRPAAPQEHLPPPMPSAPGARATPRNDDIDFRIIGNDMQFVEVELDPGESAIAEAGALMYKDAAVEMNTVFGSGAHSGQGGGFLDKLLTAGKRVVTGESLFTTVYTHGGSGKARVAFAAPYPGTVLAMKLDEHNGRLICQKDSFLAGARGVQVGIHFQRKILTGLFGGDGFIMQ